MVFYYHQDYNIKKREKILKYNKLQKKRIIAKLTCATCKTVLFGEGGEPGKVPRRETWTGSGRTRRSLPSWEEERILNRIAKTQIKDFLDTNINDLLEGKLEFLL